MTYNSQLQNILQSQLSINCQTLNVLSQSMQLLAAQQNSISRMFTVIQREHRNNDSPITLSFNTVSLSDLYDLSNNETPTSINTNDVHPILQNILNIVNMNTDTSNNESIIDISSVAQDISFSDINGPNASNICPISLEQFESNDEILRINRCGHYFKKSPLVFWFTLSKLCPVCRCDVTIN